MTSTLDDNSLLSDQDTKSLFWYRLGLNHIFFIQSSETLLVGLIETHNYM